MKAKVFIALAACCLVSALIGSLISNSVQAQQVMKPLGWAANRIAWDYDSGWQDISQGEHKYFVHNLGGDANEYFVYIIGWRNSGNGINVQCYGSAANHGAFWDSLTNDHIRIVRETLDMDWENVRIRILKNQ